MRQRWRQLSPRWKWFVTLVLIFSLFLTIFITFVYSEVQRTADLMYEEYEPSIVKPPVKDISEGEASNVEGAAKPITVLLLGVDERSDNKGRSDTMIVLALNPEDKTTKMLSIPRDTLTSIEGYREADKINHAYAYGGAATTKKTVEQLLQIPIDYVVTINMEGFLATIDAVDGVTVTNPFAFTYEGETYEKGNILLSGEQALGFVRMRYDDPAGDFGRQDRQKNVVKALLQKLATPQALIKLPTFQKVAESHVRMNIRLNDIPNLHKHYRDSLNQFESIQITQGRGEMRNGIYYYVLDPSELQDIQTDLQTFIAVEK